VRERIDPPLQMLEVVIDGPSAVLTQALRAPGCEKSDRRLIYNETRAHTHRELIREWHSELMGSSLKYIKVLGGGGGRTRTPMAGLWAGRGPPGCRCPSRGGFTPPFGFYLRWGPRLNIIRRWGGGGVEAATLWPRYAPARSPPGADVTSVAVSTLRLCLICMGCRKHESCICRRINPIATLTRPYLGFTLCS